MIGAITAGLFSAGTVASTTAYESIATVTVSSPVSSVSFSSIPSTYKHLQIRAIASGAGAQRYGVQFNGDTGANYTQHFLYGTGSAAGSGATTGGAKYNSIGASDGSTAFGASVTDILDYMNTSKNTTVRSLAGYDTNGAGLAVLYSFVWLNTAAVTSLTIQAAESYSGNFAANSTFALYGIKG
jgi:hypothetical protein